MSSSPMHCSAASLRPNIEAECLLDLQLLTKSRDSRTIGVASLTFISQHAASHRGRVKPFGRTKPASGENFVESSLGPLTLPRCQSLSVHHTDTQRTKGLGRTLMPLQHPDLSEVLLTCFHKACSEDRLDVAEHLLLALEELSGDLVRGAASEPSGALARAYSLIPEPAVQPPRSSRCGSPEGGSNIVPFPAPDPAVQATQSPAGRHATVPSLTGARAPNSLPLTHERSALQPGPASEQHSARLGSGPSST